MSEYNIGLPVPLRSPCSYGRLHVQWTVPKGARTRTFSLTVTAADTEHPDFYFSKS